MSKPRKNDKASDTDDTDEPKQVPWAIEIEFFNKPSFMASVLEFQVDDEHISVVRSDGSVMGFPYESVRKILIMQTKRRKTDLD